MEFLDNLSIFFKARLTALVLILISLYALAALLVTLNRYWQYQDFYFDFGILDMAIYRVAHFQPPMVDHPTFGSDNIISFADHFSPSVYSLAPLYWLTDRSEVLIVAQVLAVSIGGYIAFLIANSLIENKLAVFALVFAYLGFVGMQNALISDIHEVTYATLPITLLFWAYYKKRWKTFLITLLIVLGFKESLAGLGVGVSLFILIRNMGSLKKRVINTEIKIAIATALISILWGIIAIKLVIPHFSGGRYIYAPDSFPSNPLEFIKEFFIPVIKFKALFYSFLTFGFLPLFDLSILPAIFENFLERFVLTTGRGWDLGMHYSAPLSPLMFVGAMNVLLRLQNSKKLTKYVSRLAIFIILAVIILHRFVIRGPLGLSYNRVFYQQNDATKYVNDAVARFPHDGLIMTQNDLAVRLTHYNVKLLRADYKSFNPEHVILNLTPGQTVNVYSPLDPIAVTKLKDLLTMDKDYTLVKYTDYFYVFSKVHR